MRVLITGHCNPIAIGRQPAGPTTQTKSIHAARRPFRPHSFQSTTKDLIKSWWKACCTPTCTTEIRKKLLGCLLFSAFCETLLLRPVSCSIWSRLVARPNFGHITRIKENPCSVRQAALNIHLTSCLPLVYTQVICPHAGGWNKKRAGWDAARCLWNLTWKCKLSWRCCRLCSFGSRF
jgi:hypothetical protein